VSTQPRRLQLPQLLLGLVALSVAVAVSAVLVMDGVRDVKRSRDTIVVTGSAKRPIEADLATWRLSVSALEQTPDEAALSLRKKTDAVTRFLHDEGIDPDELNEPPLAVAQTQVQVPTGLKKPAFRWVPAWRIAQSFQVQTSRIDTLERAAGHVNRLLLQGVDASVQRIQYVSTRLTEAKFDALRLATADAHRRAETIAQGLHGSLGAVRDVQLGVFQITPRNSTEVSDYGINDTSTRDKDVTSVVTVTFAVNR
jgi:uncharacterized protein